MFLIQRKKEWRGRVNTFILLTITVEDFVMSVYTPYTTLSARYMNEQSSNVSPASLVTSQFPYPLVSTDSPDCSRVAGVDLSQAPRNTYPTSLMNKMGDVVT